MTTNPAIREEPHPTANNEPASWDMVVLDVAKLEGDETLLSKIKADMIERDQVGFVRYGTRLQPFNGRDSLVDAYQELLDASVYLRTVMFETGCGEGCPLSRVYKNTLKNVLLVREMLETR